MMIPFGIGVFCTSLGDGFAGVFGQIKRYNRNIYDSKTLLGFLSCLFFSFISALGVCHMHGIKINVWYAFLIASFAASLELFAKKGIDNITVTIGSAFLSYLFLNYPTFIINYMLPLIFTLPIVAFVSKKKALTTAGIIVALILDLMASIAFGNYGFSILIAFFGGYIWQMMGIELLFIISAVLGLLNSLFAATIPSRNVLLYRMCQKYSFHFFL